MVLNNFGWLCIGFVSGVIILLILIINFGDAQKDREACEASLPRDQQCVMYFKAEE